MECTMCHATTGLWWWEGKTWCGMGGTCVMEDVMAAMVEMAAAA